MLNEHTIVNVVAAQRIDSREFNFLLTWNFIMNFTHTSIFESMWRHRGKISLYRFKTSILNCFQCIWYLNKLYDLSRKQNIICIFISAILFITYTCAFYMVDIDLYISEWRVPYCF